MFHRNRITKRSDSNDIHIVFLLACACYVYLCWDCLQRRWEHIRESISTWPQNDKLSPRPALVSLHVCRILVRARVIDRIKYEYQNDSSNSAWEMHATSRSLIRIHVLKLFYVFFLSLINLIKIINLITFVEIWLKFVKKSYIFFPVLQYTN